MANPIADKILFMSSQRGPNKTICPSDVAREMFPGDWRKHMEEIRMEAIILNNDGKVLITQKGINIDTNHIKGPIRIKIVK